MLPLDYASDSEDESTAPNAQVSVEDNTVNQNRPTSTKKTSGKNGSTLGLALPPPKAKKPNAPKKFVVELPKLDKRASDDEDSIADEMPAAKKPRLGGKGGASGLLSMLPAPKKSALELPAPKRVLGGGKPGIMYSASSRTETFAEQPVANAALAAAEKESPSEPTAEEDTTTSLIPPSMLLKGKVKTSATEKAKPKEQAVSDAIDFFSLGSASSSRTSRPLAAEGDGIKPITSLGVSAAPVIEEYRPPSPKVDDPYPGYYQLPSGSWAAHDPAYYKTYADRWAKEYEAQIRAFEKTQRGFEGAGAGGEDAQEVSAAGLQDAARAAREEKKAMTAGTRLEGERALPKVSLNASKTGNLARSRHQLHSLLSDAYMNREALEEKIAQGKRNRKEAGNKYGF